MNLYLIGYRGSGKSTIAPLIAKLAQCDWVDTDDMVETTAQKSIASIFENDGETEFRRLETEAIESVSITRADSNSRLVVSLGGGAITIPANQKIVRALGQAVYLRGRAETLWKRISTDPVSGQQRPNLTEAGGLQEVKNVLAERRKTYEANSGFQIDIDDISPGEAAEKIFAWWNKQSESQRGSAH